MKKPQHAEKLFSMSLDMLCVANFEGYFIELNPAWERTLGWSIEELCAKPYVEFVHPDDRVITSNEADRLSQGEYTIRFENRYLHKDGSYRNIQWVSATDPVHKIIVATARDITEEKRRSEKSRQEKERLEISEHLAHFGTWEFDLSTGKGFWSKEVFRIHGLEYSPEPPPFDDVMNRLAPESGRLAREMFQRAAQYGEKFSIPVSFFTPAGEQRTGISIGLPVKDERGIVTKIHGTLIDTTAEQEAQMMLMHASKMSSLGEMAGGIAHEVNNPLSIIAGTARLLHDALAKGPHDPKKIEEGLLLILKTSERIAKVIRGLRSFSRNSNKDPKIESKLGPIIDDTLELCREKFASKNIQISTEMNSAAKILCRPTEISQVFMNIFSNAFDAVADTQDPWVRVVLDESKGKVRIAFIDSGLGIDPGIAQKLMQPFFTTKEAGKGTGLGLSISKKIVVDHGGEISYETRDGHTSFIVEFPLA